MKTLETLATVSLDNSAILIEHAARVLQHLQKAQSQPGSEPYTKAFKLLIEDTKAAQAELALVLELLQASFVEESR